MDTDKTTRAVRRFYLDWGSLSDSDTSRQSESSNTVEGSTCLEICFESKRTRSVIA